MDQTSITISEHAKSYLENLRPETHDSWSETILSACHILPPLEEIHDECTNTDCDRRLEYLDDPEDGGGVIRWHVVERDGKPVYGASYFCSPECLQAVEERIGHKFPDEPDLVRVGGRSQFEVEFGGAEYILDGEQQWVSIPLPGAFDGQSDHGDEYDYVGEPLYIKHDGEWVQSAVVEEVFNEEGHTSLQLGTNVPVQRLNHPEEETREEYLEHHERREQSECYECGGAFSYPVQDPPGECPLCGVELH